MYWFVKTDLRNIPWSIWIFLEVCVCSLKYMKIPWNIRKILEILILNIPWNILLNSSRKIPWNIWIFLKIYTNELWQKKIPWNFWKFLEIYTIELKQKNFFKYLDILWNTIMIKLLLYALDRICKKHSIFCNYVVLVLTQQKVAEW